MDLIADPDVSEWFALAHEHADRAQQLPRMPAGPEITHDALRPCIGGWSPYRPNDSPS